MEKIINTVRDYIAIHQAHGEKKTREAYEMASERMEACKKFLALKAEQGDIQAKQTLEQALTEEEDAIISLALEALYCRGNASFIEAIFTEKDFLKLYDYGYHKQFLPKNLYQLSNKAFRKWCKIEKTEDALIGAWVYYNLPCLGEILDNVIESMTESRVYMEEADTTKENFLYEVGSNLGWDGAPSFETSVLNTLVEMFEEIDIEDYGYDWDGFEAMAWHSFCKASMGLPYYLENEKCEFVTDVARDMLYEYV